MRSVYAEGSVTADRSFVVQPNQVVETAWIDIDRCKLGNRTRMDFAAIERAGRELLQLGDGQNFPPVNGLWEDGERFVIYDGRHEYLAALALGRKKLLVTWLRTLDE